MVTYLADGFYVMAYHTAKCLVILAGCHGYVVLSVGTLDLIDEQSMHIREVLCSQPFFNGILEYVLCNGSPYFACSRCGFDVLFRKYIDIFQFQQFRVCTVPDHQRTRNLRIGTAYRTVYLRYTDRHCCPHSHHWGRIVSVADPFMNVIRSPTATNMPKAMFEAHFDIQIPSVKIHDIVCCGLHNRPIWILIGE